MAAVLEARVGAVVVKHKEYILDMLRTLHALVDGGLFLVPNTPLFYYETALAC